MTMTALHSAVAVGAGAARADRVTKLFGRGSAAVGALDEVSVGFEAGRFSAIMGPSGSGKSTLLHCLAGLEPVTSGRIYLGDTDLSALSDGALTELRRDRIGFVFQSFNLVPTLTAERNITLPMRLGRRAVDEAWMQQVVATLGLADRLHHRPAELSGGQQQRVAVARALVSHPQIIFADEPTGNLDSVSGHDVLGFLEQAVHELGQTVVMVTHDPSAAAYADRVVFLADGRVVDEMTEPSADRLIDRLKRFGR
jgi:putative ABC transport system ATP-binding protein